MNTDWDKLATEKLVMLGLSWEHARIAVGVIAEERQNADRIGYERGYNNGFDDCLKRKNPQNLLD